MAEGDAAPDGGGARLLALGWLDEGPPGDPAELGRGLAAVHQAGAASFGAPTPLRIGPLTLPNAPRDDWPSFYAEQRLRPLLGPAADRGALSAAGVAAVERVCERLPELAGPPEPPARLHGDLWSGNVLWSGGRPYLIDPAAYGGHREVDLAMLRLFGSPGPRLPRGLRGARAARGRARRARRAVAAVPAARPRRAVRGRLRRVRRARGARYL